MSGQIAQAPILTTLAGVLQADVAPRLRDRATWHLLDWFSCATAVRNGDLATALRSAVGSGAQADSFVWGGLGNILEMDDVDKRALLHPGPSIVPAALAATDLCDASADQFLESIVKGYEATIRMGRAVGPAHYAMWHNTGTCGAIGASAACASLLHLSTEQMAHAMALAVSQAAGLWQTRHEPASAGKQLHTAHAARAGLCAAQLAKEGMRGPLTIIEGEQGFFKAMCDGANPSGIASTDSIGLIEDVSFKPWPACRHAHAAIDAALLLRESAWTKGQQIEILTYSDALKFCDRPDPKTIIEAKFSLQHAVAVVLERGEPTLADFDVDSIHDPGIATKRATISVRINDEIDARYPSRFGASLVAGGHRIDVTDALGDPENPLSRDQLEAKAVSLFAVGDVDGDLARGLVDSCLTLSQSGQAFSSSLSMMREVLP